MARGAYLPGLYYGPFFEAGRLLVRAKKMKLVMDGNMIQEATLQMPGVRKVLGQIDAFLPNAREARLLTGQVDLDAARRELSDLCPLVVVKDGPRGAWIPAGSGHPCGGRWIRPGPGTVSTQRSSPLGLMASLSRNAWSGATWSAGSPRWNWTELGAWSNVRTLLDGWHGWRARAPGFRFGDRGGALAPGYNRVGSPAAEGRTEPRLLGRFPFMQVLRDWQLELDVDQVLRGQGADPAVLRSRAPRLIDLAGRALAEGQALLDPAVAYLRLPVQSFRHEKLTLEGGAVLSGPLIAQHMGGASEVVVMLCTVGDRIEGPIREALETDPPFGLALDGLGNAATEALATAASNRFEAEGEIHGLHPSLPLSPGMVGWPVEEGQPQVFRIVSGDPLGVGLTSGGMMMPRKTISLVLGLGPGLARAGRACDYCNLRETCRYQDHYAQGQPPSPAPGP